jgi:hypothetical protein
MSMPKTPGSIWSWMAPTRLATVDAFHIASATEPEAFCEALLDDDVGSAGRGDASSVR